MSQYDEERDRERERERKKMGTSNGQWTVCNRMQIFSKPLFPYVRDLFAFADIDCCQYVIVMWIFRNNFDKPNTEITLQIHFLC